jgi:hypothetical protein
MQVVNRDEFVPFHRDLLVAVLREGETPQSVSDALVAAGIDEGRFDFLDGDEGLRILNPDGTHGTVKERMLRKAEHFTAEGRILEVMAAYLSTGRTLLNVHDIDDIEAVRLICHADELGIEDCHYVSGVKVA